MSTRSKKKEVLMDNYIKELPRNIKKNIGYEPKNEKLFLYKADYRKKEDRKFKEEFGDLNIWLISLSNGEYNIVDASNKVIWVK